MDFAASTYTKPVDNDGKPRNQKDARAQRVAARYDSLTEAANHGHYETLFAVVNEEVQVVRNLVLGWREFDWPDGFDRRTAEMIADHVRERS